MQLLRLSCLALVFFVAGCATSPESRIQRDPGTFSRLLPADQERVRRGQIAIGDTEAVVLLALGEPARRVQRLDQREGESQVWMYVRQAPRFSFGFGVGTYGRHSAFGTSVHSGDWAYQDDEALRVIFQQGRVVRIDYRKG